MAGASDEPGTFQPIGGFDILERLGSGGMGTVFKARQISLNRVVALKILKKTELHDQLPLERLRREALVTARMDHPAIVKGIDLGETSRYFYFVMEYVEGLTVRTILERKGAISAKNAVVIMIELAEALDHAFSNGVIHRDIKPGNIIVTPEGKVKLTDLGLAKGILDLTVTQDGATVGTPQYIAPEQASDASKTDIRSDIYSLGATFYHMVTGRMPFEGETVAQVITSVLYGRTLSPREANPDVPVGVDRCISKMMARKSGRRYQTPRELLEDLRLLADALRGGKEKGADGIGISWKSSRRERIRLRTVALIGLAAVAIAIGLALALSGGDGEGEAAPPAPEGAALVENGYRRGDLSPVEALARLDALDRSGDSPSGAGTGALRRELLAACETIVGETVVASGDQIDAALLEGGHDGAAALLEKKRLGALEGALGCGADSFPAGVDDAFDRSFGTVEAAVAARSRALREATGETFFTLLDEAEQEAVERIVEGAFVEAQQSIAALEAGCRNLAELSVLETVRRLFAGETVEARPFEPADLVGPELPPDWTAAHERTCRALRDQLGGKMAEAAARYGTRIDAEIAAAIAAAESEELSRGLEPIVEGVFFRLKELRPVLPAETDVVLPDRDGAVETCRAPYDARLAEAARGEERRLLLEIESAMRRRDGAEALLALEGTPAGTPPWPDREMILRWTRWIRTLSRVKERALDALERHEGLSISLKQKGITIRAELARLDRPGELLMMEGLGGRPIVVPFNDLDAIEVLSWADRSFRLEGAERFLYLYYAGEKDRAAELLDGVDDFREKAFFRERLSDFNRVEADARARVDEELTLLLETGLAALAAKDLATLGAAADRLRKEERTLSTGGVWRERRRDREAIVRGYRDLQEERAFLARLEGTFSVPVELLDGGRVRATYSFETASELNDMKTRGRGFSIAGGRLLFDEPAGGAAVQPIDSRVGLRLGEGFDLSEPVSLSFTCMASLKGTGPCLLLVHFYGESFGVRSFPDGRHTGQTAAWTGDLAGWHDYFFYPDLGADRPKKGRPVPFGFNRGELYRISLAWEGTEVLLSVDGEVVLRRETTGLKGKWCEIRTLKSAVFDDLVVEGSFRGR